MGGDFLIQNIHVIIIILQLINYKDRLTQLFKNIAVFWLTLKNVMLLHLYENYTYQIKQKKAPK